LIDVPVYALDWSSVDLEGGSVRITRSWCERSKTYVAPKTRAGVRVAPLSGWLVSQLTAHKAQGVGTGLVFPNGAGKPLGTSNTRRDVWLPLRKRAGVRALDMYSLRHTFASLGRTAGESSFNVSRVMGHSKSTLVDAVYAHSMASGLSGVAENVTARALGLKPQLRVIEGGNLRDVRETLDDSSKETVAKAASA
jgi:integrase